MAAEQAQLMPLSPTRRLQIYLTLALIVVAAVLALLGVIAMQGN